METATFIQLKILKVSYHPFNVNNIPALVKIPVFC